MAKKLNKLFWENFLETDRIRNGSKINPKPNKLFWRYFSYWTKKTLSPKVGGVSYSIMQDPMDLIRRYRETRKAELIDPIVRAVLQDIKLFVFGKVHENDFQDIVQETLIQIARGLPGFRGESMREFFGWSHAIARAQIAKFHRNAYREPACNMDLPDFETFIKIVEESLHVSDTDKLEMLDALHVLMAIDPDCAKLFYEEEFLGLSHEEIGSRLGITTDAARMRINRCHERIPEL